MSTGMSRGWRGCRRGWKGCLFGCRRCFRHCEFRVLFIDSFYFFPLYIMNVLFFLIIFVGFLCVSFPMTLFVSICSFCRFLLFPFHFAFSFSFLFLSLFSSLASFSFSFNVFQTLSTSQSLVRQRFPGHSFDIELCALRLSALSFQRPLLQKRL